MKLYHSLIFHYIYKLVKYIRIMTIKDSDIKSIIDFVKKEPRTVQEISRHISKSWLTADSYIKKAEEKTGLISIKTFRKGSRGALKVVFYNNPERVLQDDIKERLFTQIKSARRKSDFDFMELFQYIPEEKKKAHLIEKSAVSKGTKNKKSEGKTSGNSVSSSFVMPLSELPSIAHDHVYFFSGNLSFINDPDNGRKVVDIFEELIHKKVHIKILCRVNLATIKNIEKLSALLSKYPEFIEIRHCYQPLRGFIVDGKSARFRESEQAQLYKPGELNEDIRIYYAISDEEWISWLQKLFWNLFRTSVDYYDRIKEINKIF